MLWGRRGRRCGTTERLVFALTVAAVGFDARDVRAQGEPDSPAVAEEGAEERAEPAPEDPARAAFVEGTRLVREARWAQALAAFEKAAKLRPHPVVTYNIGACERAMGRYTRARRAFTEALRAHRSNPEQAMPESLATQADGYVREIDQLIAEVTMSITPAGAILSVDGRPLESAPGPGAQPTLVAGTRDAGTGEVAPTGKFRILLDPGAHVFTLTRKGFAPAVINKTLSPGSKTDLPVELGLLPATIRVASTQKRSIVRIGDVDVGPAPVDILRPAGRYRVVVTKGGMLPYETSINVQPGEQVELLARLQKDEPALTERWWFWTAIGAVVVGAAAGTYFATRSDPEPERAPVNGGTFGWTVPVP